MPIKGITDRVTPVGSGLKCLAKLYKGAEKPDNAKRPGGDLDYFRVQFEPQYEHLLPVFQSMYTEYPTEFSPIYMLAKTVQEVFPSWNEEWDASGGLIHRCDGEIQYQWRGDNGQTCHGQKSCAAPACRCKPVGRMKFLLPEFSKETGALGYFSVVTHSINDILTVHQYLHDIERINGELTGVPFVFGRAVREVSAPRQVKTANGGYAVDGRIKTEKSLFYIHTAPEFVQDVLIPALAGGVQQPALPASVPTVDADGVIVEDEPRQWYYHPESGSWSQMTASEVRSSAEGGLLDGPYEQAIDPQSIDPQSVDAAAPAPVLDDASVQAGMVVQGDLIEQWIMEHPDQAAALYQDKPGLLLNPALMLIYNSNAAHMKNSIAKYTENGVLQPTMTVGEALITLAQRKQGI